MSNNRLVAYGGGNGESNKRKAMFRVNGDNNPAPCSTAQCKRAALSLTKPSYVLGMGLKPVRPENSDRLYNILRKLVRQWNWTEAAGVLATLLKATCKESSPELNRVKYSATMELIKHFKTEESKSTKIKRIYETWMRRTGRQSLPPQARFAVQLEYILFTLTEGNLREAHEAALCVMQDHEFESNQFASMVVGMTFYELWYSTIPREMQLRNLEESYSLRQSNKFKPRLSNEIESLILSDECNHHDTDFPAQCNSYTSVMHGKDIFGSADVNLHEECSMTMNVDLQSRRPREAILSQGLYGVAAEKSKYRGTSCNDSDKLLYASILFGQEWDLCLLPLRLPQPGDIFEDFVSVDKALFNDQYKNAVKYLRVAINSMPPELCALHPLTQLLLMGGQVKEALDLLDKFCYSSELALRLRTSILEHIDHNNSELLSTCFENILRGDPTCSRTLAKLVSLHQNGVYALEPLLEMIALHLDASYAEFETWRELTMCFFKLTQYEEDRMSSCLNRNEDVVEGHPVSLKKIPEIFVGGKSGKAWNFRGRWWLTRHFSRRMLQSEVAAGRLQLLTYKAACASHIYGREFEYVEQACHCLEKENHELLIFLKGHTHNAVGFYRQTKLN